jgi:hypothetical protein
MLLKRLEVVISLVVEMVSNGSGGLILSLAKRIGIGANFEFQGEF